MATATCPICTISTRLTSRGVLYKHDDCPGGGQPAADTLTSAVSRPSGSGHDPGQAPPGESSPDARLTAVYPVRPGERNEELRYSLRSLAAHTKVERVIVVGSCPSWLTGVEHIKTRQSTKRETGPNVRLAFEAIAGADVDEFVWFNDDMFVMDTSDLGPTHRGLLADRLHKARPTGYWKALGQVAEILPSAALAYEPIHTPMPMTRHALAEALTMYDRTHGVRTIVGNLLELGGTEHPNVKNAPEVSWKTSLYLSTSDKSFKHRPIGRFIRKRFREPSPWET